MNRSKVIGALLAAATGLIVVAIVSAAVMVASWREPLVSPPATRQGNQPGNPSATSPRAGIVGGSPSTASREQRMAERERARADRNAKGKQDAARNGALRDSRATSDEEGAETGKQIDAARDALRSQSLDERMDAISDMADLDPVVAARELDNLLRGAETDDDLRLEAFDKLQELTPEGPPTVDLLLRGLTDPSARVREESAWLLTYEDDNTDPRILQALRQAYSAERDADARTSIEDALGSADPDFEPPDDD